MNRTPPLLLALGLLTATLAFSGCIGTDDPGPAPRSLNETEVRPETTSGAPVLELLVVDVIQNPVPEAEVTLATRDGSLTGEPDETGLARFAELAPGPATVDVRAPGFLDQRVELELPTNGTVEQTVTLTPEQEAGTFIEQFEFHGFFECSATWLIVAGDCLVIVRAAAEQAGVPLGENATNERFAFPFDLDPGWERAWINLTWEDPEANLGSMMRVNLEPLDKNNTEGHSVRYARAEGASPVHLVVDAGELHETASDEELVPPPEGAGVQARVFHLGLEETHRPGGTQFLGVGASIQQEFTVTVDVLYVTS